MINDNYKHSKLTSAIIGCAMKVHSKLGKGFPEIIYQKALAIELTKSQINFTREQEWPVYYDEQLIGKRRVDFVIEGKVLIEMKAIGNFDASSFSQIINYLEAFQLEIGLLINFGKDSLEFKRFTNNKLKTD
jgi:GxxExxY protein